MAATKKATDADVFRISAFADGEDAIPGAKPIRTFLPGDDHEIMLEPPSSTALMMLMATVRAGTDMEAMADIINGFFSLLSEDDQREVRARLFDKSDPLNFESITEAFINALERWSGRPISAPGRSPRSQSARGKTSQAKRSTRA